MFGEEEEVQRRPARNEETEAMRTYLGELYYAQFLESMVLLIAASPALYVAFIGRVIALGFDPLARHIMLCRVHLLHSDPRNFEHFEC